ncbi:MAG: YbgC/FadM family acyl-CoA thioesterase [Polaromonas sp.]
MAGPHPTSSFASQPPARWRTSKKPSHDWRLCLVNTNNFQWPLRVYWEDTDAGGIVFYANYLKFFERSRTEWLRSLGIEQHALREQSGGMFIVSETSLRYLQPSRLDDELIVTAKLQERGRASLIISQQVFLKNKTTAKSPTTLPATSNPHAYQRIFWTAWSPTHESRHVDRQFNFARQLGCASRGAAAAGRVHCQLVGYF